MDDDCRRNNFNPRSHEGSDYWLGKRPDCSHISIHAPTRGATGYCVGDVISLYISIHAPTRGATSKAWKCDTRRNFNPRSHEGSDVASLHSCLTHKISIHAPTRGATPFRNLTASLKIFQSTLPRGERQRYRARSVDNRYISIHAPTRGATLQVDVHGYYPNIFQSTLPRGERRGGRSST